jgi:glycosyltransferase involved in cell wall biosynthesis
MKIALATHDGGGHYESVRNVAESFAAAIAERHDLLRYETAPSLDHANCPRGPAREIVGASDVIIGFGSVLLPLLQARNDLDSDVPCVVVALGTFPRGALHVRALLPYLRHGDCFVLTCTADARIATMMLPGVTTELVPLGIQDAVFSPLAEQDRAIARTTLGLDTQSELFVYGGRVSVEKNVHSMLKVFATVWRHLADPYLYVAGPILDTPFHELGAVPVNYARTLQRTIARLGIPPQRVHFTGQLPAERLRMLYAAADVAMNLTLHHDENFGLAQLEAMACGTPVIGTAWGGLRDTVRSGVTGHAVRTVVTPVGVKIDWWDAANALYDIASATPANRWRVNTEEIPLSRYSRRAAAEELLNVIDRAAARRAPRTAIQPSPFAEQFWSQCAELGRPFARYTIGTQSFDLYRQLVGAYASSQSSSMTGLASAAIDTSVILPAELGMSHRGVIDVIDPLFPTRITPPLDIADDVHAVVHALRRQQVATIAQLVHPTNCDRRRKAITWMLEQGLAIASERTNARLPLEEQTADESLFAIRTVDWTASDFLAVIN